MVGADRSDSVSNTIILRDSHQSGYSRDARPKRPAQLFTQDRILLKTDVSAAANDWSDSRIAADLR
jgi:hypothetical protein